MIKHNFQVEGGYPVFKIEDKYYMLQDLYNRDIAAVKKIVNDLESLINGRLETVDIEGYDTTFVICSKDGCIIHYDEGDTKIGPVPVSWFRDLYKDWLSFLQDFQNRSGKQT